MAISLTAFTAVLILIGRVQTLEQNLADFKGHILEVDDDLAFLKNMQKLMLDSDGILFKYVTFFNMTGWECPEELNYCYPPSYGE